MLKKPRGLKKILGKGQRISAFKTNIVGPMSPRLEKAVTYFAVTS